MSLADTVVHAQLEVEGCTAELWLNGIPVSRIVSSPTRIPIENIAVHQLIVPGTNMLEVLIEPGESPSVARTDRREVRFEKKLGATARLIRFREGVPGQVSEGELLSETSYRWEDDSVPARIFPESSAMQVEMGAAYGRWAWQDAPDLVMGDALRQEANHVLAEIEAAIVGMHTQRFWDLTELQVRDVMRAYPAVTEEYLRSDLETMFGAYRNAPRPVLPRAVENQDYRLVAGGKMLQCIDRDYSSTFKLRDLNDASSFVSYSIFLARIDGELRVVR